MGEFFLDLLSYVSHVGMWDTMYSYVCEFFGQPILGVPPGYVTHCGASLRQPILGVPHAHVRQLGRTVVCPINSGSFVVPNLCKE